MLHSGTLGNQRAGGVLPEPFENLGLHVETTVQARVLDSHGDQAAAVDEPLQIAGSEIAPADPVDRLDHSNGSIVNLERRRHEGADNGVGGTIDL